jgi:predicted RND superfamily exporter protein
MSKIVETTHLEFSKSAFLIDLIKHENGKFYIEILQSIDSGNKSKQSIKINPSIAEDIINVLNEYLNKIPMDQIQLRDYITENSQEEIKKRYLKGVSISDLAMQFDQTEDDIKSILRNKKLAIVSNKPFKKRYWKRRR